MLGAGKSTFIEALGMYLIQLGKKAAVLAVDPSSEQGKGSILEINQNERPWPTP